ncbi:N-acetyltransferase [Peribacillus sp. NJ4]|uniref:N-acetyltransferase n=1 Tax=Peribacillus sp. NJ4 TaxID=3055862 RepID=UPI0025A1311E|nr:N-acetyltransferase [Peribacillus sp. NJ4]MDM5214643.1 N-acetyltransferase [Peribacillus sp. NJ4]
MNEYLVKNKFKHINLDDPFFDTLKADYSGFETWFKKKEDEEAFIKKENNLIQGFLYIKYETGPIKDVQPVINCGKTLKIGTLKINPHGTRLGERFIKKALDYAITGEVEVCYVTIFEKHTALVKLFLKYGFSIQGKKNGDELVLVKNMKKLKNDILQDYPLISTKDRQKYLLGIYPKYHSIMFPDSILKNESVDILKDVAITNSIHKTYVTRMKVNRAFPGDIFIIYRTATEGMKAEYTSVVTSVCVVEEVRGQDEFTNFNDFFNYATAYSIFEQNDLKYWYDRGGCYAVKMTYNAALSKRLIRKKLIEEIGLERSGYWGFMKLTDEQFTRISEEGGVSEGIIID